MCAPVLQMDMMDTVLHIKNMVCPRCVSAVTGLLHSLGCVPVEVTLGKAVLREEPSVEQRRRLDEGLRQLGFELLEDRQSVEVECIRRLVQEWVNMQGEHPRLSDYLQQGVGRDYSALSKLFSSVRGITIERYCVALRVERVKELLSYGQQSVGEIAYEMGYSSPAHLSAQFRQETGMSPSAFQRSHSGVGRRPIDSL